MKIKILFSIQHRGMRQALELSEEAIAKVVVGDLQLQSWEFAVEPNTKFYDVLTSFTSEEALRVVEP